MTILKLPQVQAKTGLGKTFIYALVKQGRFPKQVRLSQKRVGWVESEVSDWIRSRIALRDDLREAS